MCVGLPSPLCGHENDEGSVFRENAGDERDRLAPGGGSVARAWG